MQDRPTKGTHRDETYDVVVVGGGAAGLAGAVTLTRARRSVLAVDAGEPRNAPAGHVHNYLGREGTPPQELLAVGREEVTGYGGEVVRGTVAALRSTGVGAPVFEVTLDDGHALQARRLLVATGLADELPDVPGVAERWGRDVLHCPYCHGWEVRDQRIGVLATGPGAFHQAMLFRQLSADVVLLAHTGPTPGEDEMEQLSARGVRRIAGEVERLEVRDDRLAGARLRSGELVPLDAVVVAPVFRARADLLAGLGIQPTPMLLGEHVMGSYVAADPMGATAVPGVWVAGNVASARAQVLARRPRASTRARRSTPISSPRTPPVRSRASRRPRCPRGLDAARSRDARAPAPSPATSGPRVPLRGR